MFGLFIAIIGLLMIGITLYLILREFRREARVELNPDASFYEVLQNMDDEIERIREEVDSINGSFYEVVDDLNDRLNDLKRQLHVHEAHDEGKPNVIQPKTEENMITMDITKEVRKSDAYHAYEMKDETRKTPELIKEVQVFPEQQERRRILTLFNEGKTAFEIAKEVDKGIGEVQLILNLLGKK